MGIDDFVRVHRRLTAEPSGQFKIIPVLSIAHSVAVISWLSSMVGAFDNIGSRLAALTASICAGKDRPSGARHAGRDTA
jgi:hypothetical protein